MKAIRQRLTYPNVMSTVAVCLVLGGGAAIAAKRVLPKKSVGTKQLKAKSVTTAKLRGNAVTARKIKKNAIATAKIRNNAVTGAKVKESTLGTVPSAGTAGTIAGYTRKGIVRAGANSGSSFGAARSASPEIVLFSAGPFTIYAKCFANTTTIETFGIFYIRTSQDGAILDADEDGLDGQPFLDTDTPEDDRELSYEQANANQSDYYGGRSAGFTAMAPDGTVVQGELQVAVKNGNLPGGNGFYGDGNVCLFGADITVLNA
jgi:hypothetical protein